MLYRHSPNEIIVSYRLGTCDKSAIYARYYTGPTMSEVTLGASCLGSDNSSVVIDGSDRVYVVCICAETNGVANSATQYTQINNGLASSPISIMNGGFDNGLCLGWGFGTH